MNVKAALFDMDGTIIDSTYIWREIDVVFFVRRGISVSDEFQRTIASMNFMQAAEYAKEYYHLEDTAEDIVTEWKEMARGYYENSIRLKPYVKEYLDMLKQAGIKLAVCTASSRDLVDPALKNNSVYDLFDTIVSTDQVKRGKGFPDVYLLAADILKVTPSDCIVFEDILAGIKGAKAANMIAVGVYDKESEYDKQAIKELADFYIDDFSQMETLIK